MADLLTETGILRMDEHSECMQNSDVLFRTPVQWIENVEPEPINEFEKNMLKDTKSVSQLLEEERNEKPKEYTDEELLVLKRNGYITRVKVVALHRNEKHPLVNPSYFSKKEKDRLIKTMEEVMKMSDEDITKEFNEICDDVIFNTRCDYSTYPVYQTPVTPKCMNKIDC